MVNQNLDARFPEPAGLIKKLYSLTKRQYAGESQVDQAIKEVLKVNKKAVDDYQGGKKQVLGFLIGAVQAKLRGKGDPTLIRQKLIKSLS